MAQPVKLTKIDKYWPEIPLLKAAADGDTKSFERLLAKGESPNICDVGGRTAAHWAAFGGSVEILYLIDTALLSTTDNDGQLPAHKAALNGRVDVLNYLRKNNIAINLLDANGKTPLHLACKWGTINSVKWFSKNQSAEQFNVSNKKGQTPLMVLQDEGEFHKEKRVQCLKLLKKERPILFAESKTGSSSPTVIVTPAQCPLSDISSSLPPITPILPCPPTTTNTTTDSQPNHMLVDNKKLSGISGNNDLLDVINATASITDWSVLSLKFGLTLTEYSQINQKVIALNGNLQMEIISRWFQLGNASWSSLVQYLCEVRQYDVAQEIAKAHPCSSLPPITPILPCPLTTTNTTTDSILKQSPSIDDAFNCLKSKSANWEDFARELKIDRNFRKQLRMDSTITIDTKLEMIIEQWIEGQTCKVTWQTILDVLVELKFNDTASNIRIKLNIINN